MRLRVIRKAKTWWDRPSLFARAKRVMATAFLITAGLLAAILAAVLAVAWSVSQ